MVMAIAPSYAKSPVHALALRETATYRFHVVITPQRNIVSRTWGTSVGKKSVMAVTGIVFLLFVIAHMLGNLKIFFGITAFDEYSEHLRTLGAEIVGYSGVLWIIRVVLLGSVVLHMWAAFSLWYRAKKARPVGYQHRSTWQGSYAARTMRWGGVIIALFVVWHILDLTTGTVNPAPGGSGRLREARRELRPAGGGDLLHPRRASRSASTSGTASGRPSRRSAPTAR